MTITKISVGGSRLNRFCVEPIDNRLGQAISDDCRRQSANCSITNHKSAALLECCAIRVLNHCVESDEANSK